MMQQQIFDWYTIQKLFDNCTFSEEKKEEFQHRLMMLENMENEFAEDEIKSILFSFYQHQQDPILSGNNYGINDIVKHLRKLR